MPKRGLFPQDRGGDMARRADMVHGACMNATWHVRPRGRLVRAHVALKWRECDANTWQGHAGPRRRPEGGGGGATWRVRGWHVKGPRVNGPSL